MTQEAMTERRRLAARRGGLKRCARNIPRNTSRLCNQATRQTSELLYVIMEQVQANSHRFLFEVFSLLAVEFPVFCGGV